MTFDYIITDVFTETPFGGAQIAVFPTAEGLSQSNMQLIANELNLSETVFLTAGASPQERLVKVYSPLAKKGFTSQTTVAAGFALAETGQVNLSQANSAFKFAYPEGQINVYISAKDGKFMQTLFSLGSSADVDIFTPPKDELAKVLSLEQIQLERKPYRPLIVSTKLSSLLSNSYLVVPVADLNALTSARFDYQAWTASTVPATFADNILLVSTETEQHISDFRLRLITAQSSPEEDPPVGAAVPAFSAYLCRHHHIAKGTYSYVIERGSEAVRQSILHVEMDNKSPEFQTIRVGGSAILTGKGCIFV